MGCHTEAVSLATAPQGLTGASKLVYLAARQERAFKGCYKEFHDTCDEHTCDARRRVLDRCGSMVLSVGVQNMTSLHVPTFLSRVSVRVPPVMD
jgi:hypothetical protein